MVHCWIDRVWRLASDLVHHKPLKSFFLQMLVYRIITYCHILYKKLLHLFKFSTFDVNGKVEAEAVPFHCFQIHFYKNLPLPHPWFLVGLFVAKFSRTKSAHIWLNTKRIKLPLPGSYGYVLQRYWKQNTAIFFFLNGFVLVNSSWARNCVFKQSSIHYKFIPSTNHSKSFYVIWLVWCVRLLFTSVATVSSWPLLYCKSTITMQYAVMQNSKLSQLWFHNGKSPLNKLEYWFRPDVLHWWAGVSA